MLLKDQIKVIGLDADDTLWANEPFFQQTEAEVGKILAPYLNGEDFGPLLYEVEKQNLSVFGYGVKGFTISMVEAGIKLSEGKISANEIQQIVDLGREMLQHPVELLEGVAESVERLSSQYKLLIITKGDLLEQERKIKASELTRFAMDYHVVSEKKPHVYAEILFKHKIKPEHFLMIGNSLPSDVFPVLEIGGHGIHIPFHTTWVHEQIADHKVNEFHFWKLNDIREVESFLSENHV